MKVIGNKILVEPIQSENKTEGGIILTTVDNSKPLTGIVTLVGNGTSEEKMEIEIGNVVMFSKSAGFPIKVENKDYLILRQAEILIVLNNKN
jgi:chaperonin GroES